jgi:hypothetical protein
MQYFYSNEVPYGGKPFGKTDAPYMGQQRNFRRLRSCLGCLAMLLVVLIAGAMISTIFGISLTGGPTVIQVASHPTLIVESEVYTDSVINRPVIHIHAGQDGQIVIQPHRPLGIPFGFPEVYRESGDHQTVIYNYDLASNATGTFEIAVPSQTNLKVDTNSWSVQVEGITGQMILTSNSGNLTLKNCHLLNPSLVKSISGQTQITQDQFSALVTLGDTSDAIAFQATFAPVKPLTITRLPFMDKGE